MEHATNYVDKKCFTPLLVGEKNFLPPPEVGGKKVLPPLTMLNRSQMFILQPPLDII